MAPDAALSAMHALPFVAGPLPLIVAPFFSRIARSAALAHPTRQAVYDLLRARGGLRHQDIARELGLGLVNAIYHVRRLEEAGLVAGREVGRRMRWYVPGAAVDLARSDALQPTVAAAIASL